MDGKTIGLNFLLGLIVIVLTPIIGGLFSGIAMLQTALFGVTLAAMLGAGISATAAVFVIENYLK